jgi:hypothetical protein
VADAIQIAAAVQIAAVRTAALIGAGGERFDGVPAARVFFSDGLSRAGVL